MEGTLTPITGWRSEHTTNWLQDQQVILLSCQAAGMNTRGQFHADAAQHPAEQTESTDADCLFRGVEVTAEYLQLCFCSAAPPVQSARAPGHQVNSIPSVDYTKVNQLTAASSS